MIPLSINPFKIRKEKEDIFHGVFRVCSEWLFLHETLQAIDCLNSPYLWLTQRCQAPIVKA